YIVISKRDGKLSRHQTRVIARNTCLNLNQNDYIYYRRNRNVFCFPCATGNLTPKHPRCDQVK
ncbi:MAG: hypothetical protein MGU50_22485, partial [Trichodesmium sp. MAG_R02]|nr:hypothetical protein [Trichodesmium sp. MAG_R02]